VPQRLANPLAQRVVLLDSPFELPELSNRETLPRSGLLDRQAVVFLHRLVNGDVPVNLAGRNILIFVVALVLRYRGRGLRRESKRLLLKLGFNLARTVG